MTLLWIAAVSSSMSIRLCLKGMTVLERHGRHLLFDDTTAYVLWDEYTLPVEDPLPGDLIFFTDGVSDEVSHIAIFIREEAGVLFFIDASSLPDTMKVMERSYPADNAKIHSFARMRN